MAASHIVITHEHCYSLSFDIAGVSSVDTVHVKTSYSSGLLSMANKYKRCAKDYVWILLISKCPPNNVVIVT